MLFVESLGLRQPQLAGRDLKRIVRACAAASRRRAQADGLHVLSPLVIPLHRFAAVRALNRRLLPSLVRRAARRLGFERPILWAYVPQAEALLDALDPSLVVYHCVDDIAAQPGIDGASFRAAEERFAAARGPRAGERALARARACARSTATCSTRRTSPTPRCSRARCEPGPVDAALDALPRPRIVFTGAVVATKLDVPLLVGAGARAAAVVVRARRPGRRRATRAPTSPRSRLSRTSTCSAGAPTTSCPTCCAAPTPA